MNLPRREGLKKVKKVKRTENVILHAAKVQFEEKGIENVTVDDIAYEAEVCRMTIFNRFGSMENLMSALFNIEINELCKFDSINGKNGIEAIKLLFEKLIETSINYPRVTSKLINVLILSKEAENIKRIESIINGHLKYENRIKPLKVLDTFPLEKTTELVMGIYYGMLNQRHIMGYSFLKEEMIKEFNMSLDYLINGGGNE
ncbi:MAG TPA: helix-turn-helix domain-containing protein [Anaerovoracaceae bacterium]|nr:helix-turn-helix domain-containing protein [Anaerovoracaceae bacterium]